MAVDTEPETEALRDFVGRYGLGALRASHAVRSGAGPARHLLATEAGEFVLSLFGPAESVEAAYLAELLGFLAERGLPCPHPLSDPSGASPGELAGRPAMLAPRLPGRPVARPGTAHCGAVGDALGHLHVAASAFAHRRANERGPRWWRETAAAVQPQLDATARALLDKELHFQSLFRFADLPWGVIHADPRRAHVLFEGDRLGGLLGFEGACDDALLFDLAIAVNDWCSDAEGALEPERTAALLDAYRARRPFAAIERGAWPVLLRAAALRSWLVRLREGAGDAAASLPPPSALRRILERRIAVRAELPAG